MITKQQLRAMSDFEVNKALSYSAEMDGVWRDYCNIPNDIMPLAFEYKLNILSPDAFSSEFAGGWNCFNDGGSCVIYDANPLRAIACCLILVLQEQKQ